MSRSLFANGVRKGLPQPYVVPALEDPSIFCNRNIPCPSECLTMLSNASYAFFICVGFLVTAEPVFLGKMGIEVEYIASIRKIYHTLVISEYNF